MYSYAAKLVRVIDGDTVVLDLDLGFRLWRFGESYRLGRIDTPEMNTDEGKQSKAWLENALIRAASLSVVTSKADKYGRWLIELFADGVCVNDQLVTAGRAQYRSY